jgi:hypothetical protein
MRRKLVRMRGDVRGRRAQEMKRKPREPKVTILLFAK